MDNFVDSARKKYTNIKLVLKDTYKINGKKLYWNDVESEFDKHILNLFLGIASCHYPISESEIAFIKEFFPQYDVKTLLETEDESTKNNRGKFLLTQMPLYLSDMINMDINKTKLIVELILEMGVELASVDEDYSETECKFITAIAENLKGKYLSKTSISKNFFEKYKNIANNTLKSKISRSKDDEIEEKTETLEDIMEELDELVGLDEIKSEITTLINLTKVNSLREKRGLKAVTMSRHMVFTGSPGTGKTTIARIIARIYKVLGVLSKGHLVETDRAELVAGYVGQTAANVKKVAESALGGILFIDEAYSLTYSDSSADFGREAVDTLVKFMEDNRKDLVVIVAGYPNEMKSFINSNPGLVSRFNKYINFKDYTIAELFEIFMRMIAKNMFIIGEEASIKLKEFLELKSKEKGFGNGRGVRNCFEKLLEIQANRVISIENISDKELQTISKEDVMNLCD